MRILSAAGIPTLLLSRQAFLANDSALARIGEFVASLEAKS
jgi:hypothetical protein